MKAGLLAIVFFAATICLMAQTNIDFTRLVSFDGTNGAMPEATLTSGRDGNFYGTTRRGGKYDKGTIFCLTTDEKLRTIFSFDGTNAGEPFAELVCGNEGKLFGTCRSGDVFSILTNGSGFKILHRFSYENIPLHGLTLGSDGYVYGSIPYGGKNRDGAIFKMTPDGDWQIILSFDYQKTGAGGCDLISGRDGFLYGTISGGGKYDGGVFFRLTTDGAFTILASFPSTNLFRAHRNKLVQASDGNFYGTTECGGTNNTAQLSQYDVGDGTVFKVTTNGVVTTLANFNGWNGAHPTGALVQGADGGFYGVTEFDRAMRVVQHQLDMRPSLIGWEDTHGTIFRVTTNGSLKTLYSFTLPDSRYSGTNGSLPCGLVMDSNENFYGTTTRGGFGFAGGTIFKFRVQAVAQGRK